MANPPPEISDYQLTAHARRQLQRRQIEVGQVEEVLLDAEESQWVREGRAVYQSRIGEPDEGTYLLRVFVDVDSDPPAIVTAYRTSRIEKYWEGQL